MRRARPVPLTARLATALVCLAPVAACGSDDEGAGPPPTATVAAPGATAATAGGPPPTEDVAVTSITIEVDEPAGADGPFTFDALAAGDPAAAAEGGLVLLLHGFPESSHSWDEFLVPLAEAGWYAVAPDQRGYSPGARADAVDAYAITNLVADVGAIADELGAERFHVVGHDWGGAVAWASGVLLADRVTSVTSLSTPHPDALGAAIRDPASEQAAMSGYMTTFREDGAEQRLLADGPATFVAIFGASGMPEADAEAYAELLGTPDALGAALDWYRANPLPMPEELRLGPVAVPVLYVWGSNDLALGRTAAELTAASVSGPYRFVELAGAGHWLPEVNAAEVVVEVLDHLAEHGAS